MKSNSAVIGNACALARMIWARMNVHAASVSPQPLQLTALALGGEADGKCGKGPSAIE